MTDTTVRHEPADTATHPARSRRGARKAATRQKALDAAVKLFTSKPYAEVTIRDLASEMGMSTGAVFANFASKADLWREAMNCEPPVDGPVVRAASHLLKALQGVIAIRPENWADEEDAEQAAAWRAADEAVALATSAGDVTQ